MTKAARARDTNHHHVLVALTHETLNAATFGSIADVAEAVKRAAAGYRVPYTSATVAAALRSVGARRPLLASSSRGRP